MDILAPTLASFNPDERKQFRLWISRQGNPRLEIQLFDLMTGDNELSYAELRARLYQNGSMHGYKKLRTRLLNRVTEFLVLRRLESDHSGGSNALAMISICHYLIGKNIPEVAIEFLRKAEAVARKHRKYEILEVVYPNYIACADELNLDVEPIISRAEYNGQRYLAMKKLIHAHAVLRQLVRRSRRVGELLDVENQLNTLRGTFNLSVEEANDPAYMVEYVSMFRSAIISGKDYIAFERFAKRIYWRMSNASLFQEGDIEYETGFIFMIAHAVYRNRRFAESLMWLELLESKVVANNFPNASIYPKYISLKAAVASYSGDNVKAVYVMQTALKSRNKIAEIREILNMKLNLAVYHFQANDFRKAIRMLQDLGFDDKWLEERMGKEWRFKKEMIELIVHYELSNEELSVKMLNRMLNYYSGFLNHPVYFRAKLFLDFVSIMIKDPHSVSNPEFRSKVREAQLGWPGYKEDVQAITFFCWLLSKIVKRPYYEVLLERVQEDVETIN